MTTINLPLPAAPAAPAAPSPGSGGAPGAPAGAGAPALPGAPAEPGSEGGTPQEFAELLAALVAPLVAQVTAQPVAEVAVEAPVAAGGDTPVAMAAVMPEVVAALVAAPTVVAATTVAGPGDVTIPAPADGRAALAALADGVDGAEVDVHGVGADVPTGADGPDEAPAALGGAGVHGEPALESPATPTQPSDAPPEEVVAAGQPTLDRTAAAAPAEEQPGEVAPVAEARAEAPATPQPAVTTQTTVRVQDAAPVAGTEAPAAPRHAAPAEQVAVAVTPLLQREDGSYHVSLRLHPEELGAVHVDVELRNGEVHLAMRADGDAGRDALKASLPSLRAELEAAGVRAGSLDVADGMAGRTPDRQEQGRRGDDRTAFAGGIDAVDLTTTETETSGADGAVDVRM